MQDKIRRRIIELADEQYRQFHSRLCPGIDNIIGVRVPILRGYAKEIIKEDWREYLKSAKNDYYEEIMLQGMVIGLAKADINEISKYIEQFVPKINNWAVCDVFCAGLKITKKNTEYMWEFIQKYIKSENEFEIRFAIIMMLDFYITEEYIDRVIKIIDNIKHEGYYVKMAIAWIISLSYIKYEEKTKKYLQNNNLDSYTYNKALQKIVESNRIDKQTKIEIKKLKR